MAFFFSIVCACTLAFFAFIYALIYKRQRTKRLLSAELNENEECTLVSFFHPYCNSGGGGERVLWTGIKAILERFPWVFIFIYTNDVDCLSSPYKVFENVRNVFGIEMKSARHDLRISFVPLACEPLLRPSLYPHFTLAGQAIGSVVAAIEAVIRQPCDVFIDTTGFAFTMPVFAWLIGATCGSYVHFPTISSDMEDRVRRQGLGTETDIGTSYNNSFGVAYGWAGSLCNVRLVAVNSSWTLQHIEVLWGRRPVLLYPPCPVRGSNENAVIESLRKRNPWIVSIGQFRPEKNHELQIHAFAQFLKGVQVKPISSIPYRLILVGGCRDQEDYSRVDRLKALVSELKLTNFVNFRVNAPWTDLNNILLKSTINLHTMVDEHFGIGIVEGMAARMVTVAHRSGGPLQDIIGPQQAFLPSQLASSSRVVDEPVGFLAKSVEEYAETFHYILVSLNVQQRRSIGQSAHNRAVSLFSEEAFSRGWINFLASTIGN